jgi:acyl-CoA dehydrogenase
MDFSVPTKTSELLVSLREFLDDKVLPLEPKFLKQSFKSLVPELRDVRAMVRERGWWLPQISRDRGGMGLGFMEHAMVTEVLGRSPLGHYVFNAQAPDAGNMEVLLEFGSPAQQARWLSPLLRGEIRSCFSMTEPDRAGSNPVWMDTTATLDGDDYVIQGRKWFTSSADGAAFAIVMAVTNPDARPHERASQIIVPTDTPGFRLVRNISCMGHEGDDWASHAEVDYESCRVPVANRIGDEGQGFSIAQARLGPGRIHHCMRWIGIAERSFEIMCQRVVSRELAPNETLAQRQTIQNWIAESRAEIDASRLLVLQAAWKIDQKGSRAARVDISVIKFTVAGMMLRVIDRAIQCLGALGISDDTILSFFYRNERAARIYDGADEVHKSVVARKILKSFKSE